MVRHYMRLSHMNYPVDTRFYPLGSCTMKYNPKVNEDGGAAARASPTCTRCQPDAQAQGALALMYELQECLQEIGGMDAVYPAARGGRARRADGHPDHRAAYHRDARRDSRAQVVSSPTPRTAPTPPRRRMAGFDVRRDPVRRAGATSTSTPSRRALRRRRRRPDAHQPEHARASSRSDVVEIARARPRRPAAWCTSTART